MSVMNEAERITEEAIDILNDGYRIAYIKILRNLTGLSLKDCKTLADNKVRIGVESEWILFETALHDMIAVIEKYPMSILDRRAKMLGAFHKGLIKWHQEQEGKNDAD